MGQSLVRNYLHIVFSTKHRKPLIQIQFESSLHAYVASICNDHECWALEVGSHLDHIHIACMLSKKIALMDLMQEVKARSSSWFKTLDRSLGNFYWQNGYGAFSVSPNQIERVRRYIRNQHVHHATKGFQDEYRGYLKKYQIDYDERYVWD